MKIDVPVWDRDEEDAPGGIYIETGSDEQGTVMLHVRTDKSDEPVSAALSPFDLGVLVGALRWVQEGE